MLNLIVFLMLLTGCAYSINMIHSEGTSSDLIDENETASPDISPTVTLPLMAGGHPIDMPGPDPTVLNGAGQPRNYPPDDPRGANGQIQPC